MILSEAIKSALRHRQSPMTPQQIAYFISFNHMVLSSAGLSRMVRAVEEAVYLDPGTFTVHDELVCMSSWCEHEREVVQRVFSKVQEAIALFKCQGTDCCNNLVLALLLYKRLSDIERSQQLGAPIIPKLWKFNRVTTDTMLLELSARVYEVMDYVERTDDRLAHTFLRGKEQLNNMNDLPQLRKLQEVMRLLATLQLDEEHVPTPLFQAIFSRLFWNNVRHTSKELAEEY
jgi:hypothetical protein